ncbi:hypothetical protein AgCh_031503 [Apium graveolens]
MTDNDIKNYWNIRLKKKMNVAVCGRYVCDGRGSNNNTITQSNNNTNLSKDVWVRRLQNNVNTAKEALYNAISNSPMTSTHDPGVVTPSDSLILSSSLLMGTNSLHTSDLTSFSSPSTWNMTVDNQDLLNNVDEYHLRSHKPPPIIQESNYFTTSYPCTVGNISQWLQKWTREYPNKESVAGNIADSMVSNPPVIGDEGMINEDSENAVARLFTSTENSILHNKANYTSPVSTTFDPSLPTNILDRKHEENDNL